MFVKNMTKTLSLSALVCAVLSLQAHAQQPAVQGNVPAPSFATDSVVSGSAAVNTTASAPVAAQAPAAPTTMTEPPIVNELKVSDPELLRKVKYDQEEIMLMELDVKKQELAKKLDDLKGGSEEENFNKSFSNSNRQVTPSDLKLPTASVGSDLSIVEVDPKMPKNLRIRKEYGRMVAVLRMPNGNDMIVEEGKLIGNYKVANIYNDRVVVKRADKKDAKPVELEFVGNSSSDSSSSSSSTVVPYNSNTQTGLPF